MKTPTLILGLFFVISAGAEQTQVDLSRSQIQVTVRAPILDNNNLSLPATGDFFWTEIKEDGSQQLIPAPWNTENQSSKNCLIMTAWNVALHNPSAFIKKNGNFYLKPGTKLVGLRTDGKNFGVNVDYHPFYESTYPVQFGGSKIQVNDLVLQLKIADSKGRTHEGAGDVFVNCPVQMSIDADQLKDSGSLWTMDKALAIQTITEKTSSVLSFANLKLGEN
jgi:hypothetical protein